MDGQMTTMAQHPEEIECFRNPSGGFSPDKRYEYTYATRKSWEFIPTLGRKDWRYFANKGFTYAGKWLRCEANDAGGGMAANVGRCFSTTVSAPAIKKKQCRGIMMRHCVIGSSLLRNSVILEWT